MIDLPRGSLSGRAHILVIVATVIIALFIFRLVRARQLRSKYALLWLVIGVLLLPLAARLAFAFIVLAPLGVCLGFFMPLGLGAVAGLTRFPREYVAWGWAVNGFASVVGAVLSTILAMTFGFRVVLFLALVAYAIAILALRGLLRLEPSAPTPEEPAVPSVTGVPTAAAPR